MARFGRPKSPASASREGPNANPQHGAATPAATSTTSSATAAAAAVRPLAPSPQSSPTSTSTRKCLHVENFFQGRPYLKQCSLQRDALKKQFLTVSSLHYMLPTSPCGPLKWVLQCLISTFSSDGNASQAHTSLLSAKNKAVSYPEFDLYTAGLLQNPVKIRFNSTSICEALHMLVQLE